MKRRLGYYAAIGAAISVIVFFLSMIVGFITPTEYYSYAVCLVLSWCYVMLACDFCADALPDRKSYAYAGLAFSVMYSVFVNIVYFAQITVIRQNAMNPEIIQNFKMVPGTLYFAYDILGYGLMGLSTLFLGVIVRPQDSGDRWLKTLLIMHGVFFPLSVVMPATGLFSSADSSIAGTYLLMGWCVYFAPIMILAARYCSKPRKQAAGASESTAGT